jgi:hypothetical protein
MSARNDETWLFVVEWFDPMPRLKRMYLLKYFVQQHQVEMVCTYKPYVYICLDIRVIGVIFIYIYVYIYI